MERKNKASIFFIIGAIIFALSSTMLSFQLIIENYYTNLNIFTTIIISFICAIWFYKKTIKENCGFIKDNIIFTIICMILAIIVDTQLYLTKGIECKKIFNQYLINPFKIRFFIISVISLIYLFIYLGNKIKQWILNFYKLLDSWDKNAYVIASVISFIIIAIAYSMNSNWYLQYDKVYSLDSGWCFNNIFPESTYYDIRHPILSIFTFPIWAITNTLVNFIIPGNLSSIVIAIILQIINAQLLILIGFQIKILTKNKLVFILYMLSFSTILNFMFFEKYQLCTFLLVLYVFTICIKKDKSVPTLIASAGVMPTSCVIGVSELLTSNTIKEKIKKVLKIIFITLLTFICLGRAHILKCGINEMKKTKENFSKTTYTTQEKIISTTKMIQSSFTALPSSTNVKEGKYLWSGLENNVSIISIIIISILIIGIIKNRKNLFAQISSIWLLFSAILFILLNWSTHETPLFTIYFSWSIIPLFVMGLDFIIQKAKLNKKVIYGLILTFITIINIATMFDINNFLLTL